MADSGACLLCRKTIPRAGIPAVPDFRKKHPTFSGCQGGSFSFQLNPQNDCHAQNSESFSVMVDGGGTGSAQEADRKLKNVAEYVHELESHVCILRRENYEIKKAMQHMFTIAQATNNEAQENNIKLNSKVDSLVEVLDNGCPCSVNLDAQIRAVHCKSILIERKIDGMRVDIREMKQELLKDRGNKGGADSDLQPQH